MSSDSVIQNLRIPVESLFRIMEYSCPSTLLTLADSCKCIRRLLFQPSKYSDDLWITAKEAHCAPGVPRPLSGVTQFQHARFLFGRLPCHVCGSPTSLLPFSYALCVKLCDRLKPIHLPEPLSSSITSLESTLVKTHYAYGCAAMEYKELYDKMSEDELDWAAHTFLDWCSSFSSDNIDANMKKELGVIAWRHDWRRTWMLETSKFPHSILGYLKQLVNMKSVYTLRTALVISLAGSHIHVSSKSPSRLYALCDSRKLFLHEDAIKTHITYAHPTRQICTKMNQLYFQAPNPYYLFPVQRN
ncbi:hypothetical protein M422DRAFT_50412 [Sphaerobolus stellatus SS14]|uniref:F-box domain-containing protein n=1 Tax=Sphaerobolus stellatus (strain SS14) TaxID=990650 RepID=A0A0C9VJN3_SPHS4|nr:hypothetical protein M422DRAFT_50412 [Sphaerobolus stellatus SS14]